MAPLQLKELKEAPRRRAAASPVDMYSGYAKGYAPARPVMDTFIAPSVLPAKPADSNPLGQLSKALATVQPGLNQFLNKTHEDEGKAAQAAAIEAARLRENIDATWDEFYRRNPNAPRAMDPRFKAAYMRENLRLNAQTWGRTLFEQIQQNPDGILDPEASQEQVEEFLQKQATGLLKKYEDTDPLAKATALHPVMDDWLNKAAGKITQLRLQRLEDARYETASQTFTEWVKADLESNVSAEQIGRRIALHAKELVKSGLNGTKVNDLIWQSYVALATKLDDPDLAVELAAATKTRPDDPKSPNLLDIGRIGIRADSLKESLTNQKLERYRLARAQEKDRRDEAVRVLSNTLADRLNEDPLADVTDLREKARAQGVLAQFDATHHTIRKGMLESAEVAYDDPETVRSIRTAMNRGYHELARKLADVAARDRKLKSTTYRSIQARSRTEESYERKVTAYESYSRYRDMLLERVKRTFTTGDANPLTGTKQLSPEGLDLIDDINLEWSDEMREWLKEYRQEHDGAYPSDLEVSRKARDLFKEMRKSMPKPPDNGLSLKSPSAEAAAAKTGGQQTQQQQASPFPTKLNIALSDLSSSTQGAGDAPVDDLAVMVQEQLGLLYPSQGARLVQSLKSILKSQYDFPYDETNPHHQQYLRAVIEQYLPLWRSEKEGSGG
ncbi:MAG: hypothetical protein KKE29_19935 [Proteobacteria bacterium]|nr:hypothetical protein [Pseudomonadota bacterium]MBV1715961.1 hypothetical protein [Desulfarculus sp.]